MDTICSWHKGLHRLLHWLLDILCLFCSVNSIATIAAKIIEKYSIPHISTGDIFRENIKNGTYTAVTPVYAVTWAGNDNPNVKKLLDWILSEEGQYIIEETGYVGIQK